MYLIFDKEKNIFKSDILRETAGKHNASLMKEYFCVKDF